jgi:predicted DNA-binding ribbon-helix-helix protein
MARLTVTLPDDLHRALKEAAARRGTTIGALVAESLSAYGINSRDDAAALVVRVRAASGLPQTRALTLAVRETRAARRR